jgi:hypothetical protein
VTDELEFAVFSWSPFEGLRHAGPGLGGGWNAEEVAREHYAYLTGPWRERLQAEAVANEESSFEGGNWAYQTWNNARSGKKHLRFALVSRPKPPPANIVEAEEGFQVE